MAFLFALLFSCCLQNAEGFDLFIDSSHIPLPALDSLRYDADGYYALNDSSAGAQVLVTKEKSLRVISPFRAKSWAALCFSDSLLIGTHSTNSVLFSCQTTQLSKPGIPTSFMEGVLLPGTKESGRILQILFRPSSDPKSDSIFRIPLTKAEMHCLELHLEFHSSDSVSFMLHHNNNPVARFRSAFYLPKELFVFTTFVFGTDGGFSGSNYIKRLELTKTRVHVPPARPSHPSVAVAGNRLTLKCAPFTSEYRDEKITHTRWQLYRLNEPDYPIFDTEEKDPYFFSEMPVPFDLDSGRYYWHVRFRNNFNRAGAWSTMDTFEMASPRPPSFTITGIRLSKAGTTEPIHALTPDQWMDATISLSAQRPWRDLGYLLLWLSRSDYTYGNPGNKGGVFLPERNYVANLSMGMQKDSITITLYQKEKPEGHLATVVKNGGTGLYLDGSANSVLLDTVKGILAVRLKLLKNALPGTWYVSAYATGPSTEYLKKNREVLSNVYRTKLELVSSKRPSYSRILMLVFSIGAMLLIVVQYAKRKKKMATVSETVEVPEIKPFERERKLLIEFINNNLSNENLTKDDVRRALGLNHIKFYQVLNKMGISSVPNFINELRIEAAKKALKEGEKSISDIAFSTGFKDLSYFSKVFKSFTGKSPRDFRQQA